MMSREAGLDVVCVAGVDGAIGAKEHVHIEAHYRSASLRSSFESLRTGGIGMQASRDGFTAIAYPHFVTRSLQHAGHQKVGDLIVGKAQYLLAHLLRVLAQEGSGRAKLSRRL